MNSRINRLLSVGLLGALLACGLRYSQPTLAYVNHAGWWPTKPDGTVPVYYKWGDRLQIAGSAWRVGFERGRDDWNTRPTKPRWYEHRDGPNTWNTYSANDGFYGKASWLLVTSTNQFNYCNAFGNTYSTPGSRTDNEYRSTGGHELGHCLGIDHSNVADSIMRTGRDRNTIFSPRQDDVDALKAKYP